MNSLLRSTLLTTVLFSTALISLGTSCASAQGSGATTEAVQSSMRDEVQRFVTDRRGLDSFYAMDRAPMTMARQAEFDRSWRGRLAAVDYESLGVAERIDYHLLTTEIEFRERKRALLQKQIEECAPFLVFREAITELETTRWEGAELDLEQAAETLDTIARQAREVLKDLKDEEREGPEVDGPLALRLANWIRSAKRDLRTWHGHYSKFLPPFEWWCSASYDDAQEDLDKLAKHLKENIAKQKGKDDDPLVGQPIGAEALAIELAHEWLAYTPEELIAVGEAQFAWCEAELRAASEELGFGDRVHEAIESVKAMHVAPGEQDALVMAQAREAIAWLKENDLVTIPPLCEETWRVRMIDERTQRYLPFAAYGGQSMQVAFPTSVMDFESKQMSMRGNNKHFTRCVTPHELIPGHHLQGFMAERYATWRRSFRTPFLVEGWALYWEMVEYEMGWPKGPEDRIGMLFWRMHRAARIIVSLKFHLGQMQPEEMIDFLVERVGHERDNATSEVRRYIGPAYSPLYQCGYMIGGLQLRALEKEVVGGGHLSSKAYHDAILRENAIPIEMIRASLLNEKLARDASASWKPSL